MGQLKATFANLRALDHFTRAIMGFDATRDGISLLDNDINWYHLHCLAEGKALKFLEHLARYNRYPECPYGVEPWRVAEGAVACDIDGELAWDEAVRRGYLRERTFPGDGASEGFRLVG